MVLQEDITFATQTPEFSASRSFDPRTLGAATTHPVPPTVAWEPIDDRTWLITVTGDDRTESVVWDVTSAITLDGRIRSLTADLVRSQTLAWDRRAATL